MKVKVKTKSGFRIADNDFDFKLAMCAALNLKGKKVEFETVDALWHAIQSYGLEITQANE